jgi:hypothetical protein
MLGQVHPDRPRTRRPTLKWVTRTRPKTDRIACPWLIRRSIDPDAEFMFVPADQVISIAERVSGNSFDSKGATYDHRGNKCTFEVLIDDYGLADDAALMRLARIVHAADIESEGHTDPFAPMMLALASGGLDVEGDDLRLLERASYVYDALYAWCVREVAAGRP